MCSCQYFITYIAFIYVKDYNDYWRYKMIKEKKKSNKCLLLKTPDNRCFFTEEKHFPCLIEFGKTFNAEISVVKLKEEIEVLELEDLAKSLCTHPPTEVYPIYEVVETKLVPEAKVRTDKASQPKEISEFIRTELLAGKTVSLSDLETKYENVKRASLSGYVSRVKWDLTARGYYIVKEKPGKYRMALEMKADYNDFI